jgi:hypothetical protein
MHLAKYRYKIKEKIESRSKIQLNKEIHEIDMNKNEWKIPTLALGEQAWL